MINYTSAKLFVFLLLLISVDVCRGQVFDLVVAKDGSGDYPSIHRAINAIPLNSSERTLIYIKSGTYVEKIRLHETHQNVSFIGEGKDKVIIQWDDYNGDDSNNSTSSSYTFLVEGKGFYAENITFANVAGDVGQAVAVSTTGDHQIFKNCNFLGFQDTYYAKSGMQYLLDSYIEGATDFIFGESTAVFENCEIRCVEGGQYITAPADTKLITRIDDRTIYHGLLFLNCNITAAEGVSKGSYYLGRPWQPHSSTVFVHSVLGDQIRTEGWSTWSGDNHLTGFFAEYQSKTPSGDPVDVSNRVDWSDQLSDTEIQNYYNKDFFLEGWDPNQLTTAPDVPDNVTQDMLTVETGFRLSWDAVEGAVGYIVYRNDSTVGFSTSAFYEDSLASMSDKYRVRAVNESGALSDFSSEVEALVILGTLNEKNEVRFVIRHKRIELAHPTNVWVYSLSGKKLIEKQQVTEVDIRDIHTGMCIIRLEDGLGKATVKRVAL